MSPKTLARIGSAGITSLATLLIGCTPDVTTVGEPVPPSAPGIRLTAAVSPALTSSLDPGVTFTIQNTNMHVLYDISDAGLGVGDDFSGRAAIWTEAGGIQPVGVLGGPDAQLRAVNGHDQAAGRSRVSFLNASSVVLFWSSSTGLAHYGALPGFDRATGTAINDAGDVAGWDEAFGGTPFFRSAAGVFTEVLTNPFVAGFVTGMNNDGAIVGWAYNCQCSPVSHAVIWPQYNAPLVVLGSLGGDRNVAESINDAGDIVGWSELTPGSTARHAVLWPATGGMVDLSTWPNGCVGNSEAFDVNDGGIIVGHCNDLPVLWTAAEGMRYLPIPGWGAPFAKVWRINNNLQMVAAQAYWEVANQLPTADAGGPYDGAEGGPVVFDGSGSDDPDDDALTYAWTFGDGGTGTGVAPTHAYTDNGTFHITLVVTDSKGAVSATSATTAVIDNVAPTVSDLTIDADPVPVGATVNLTGVFRDPSSDDTHTAAVDWDDETASASAAVNQGPRTFTASHLFTEAGVYTIRVTVTDDDGASGSATATQYVVVYDPSAGFVTGGGSIQSPPGSCVRVAICGTSDPGGRATFGFVARYRKGATIPTGNTEFQYHIPGLNFSSVDYQWLVVAGAQAKYKGTGSINGAGNYAFLLTAIDGQQSGGGGQDRFRIKIWDVGSGELVYDNQPGAGEDSDASTALSGGSITIHH